MSRLPLARASQEVPPSSSMDITGSSVSVTGASQDVWPASGMDITGRPTFLWQGHGRKSHLLLEWASAEHGRKSHLSVQGHSRKSHLPLTWASVEHHRKSHLSVQGHSRKSRLPLAPTLQEHCRKSCLLLTWALQEVPPLASPPPHAWGFLSSLKDYNHDLHVTLWPPAQTPLLLLQSDGPFSLSPQGGGL